MIQPTRDTKAWQIQAWLSFIVASTLCAVGLMWLPGTAIEQAFMVMGYVFSLSVIFALSKFVRDQAAGSRETPMWAVVVWSGFAMAVGLTGWGLWQMAINPGYKAYLMVSWLFLISSAFTLAKMVRDAHDHRLALIDRSSAQ